MTNRSVRTKIAALVIGFAALGAFLAPSTASAKGFPGGGFPGGGFPGIHPIHFGGPGGGWDHRRWDFGRHRDYGYWHGRGLGYRYVGFRDPGSCFLKQAVDIDGNIVLRKVCY